MNTMPRKLLLNIVDDDEAYDEEKSRIRPPSPTPHSSTSLPDEDGGAGGTEELLIDPKLIMDEARKEELDKQFCRSPVDFTDIISDIVDDLATLTGISTLVAPMTDADPKEDCITGSLINFLKNDFEEFLTEGNACDFRCGEGQPCAEPMIFSSPPSVKKLDTVKVDKPVLVAAEPQPTMPPKPKKVKKKPKRFASIQEDVPKKPCCASCIIM